MKFNKWEKLILISCGVIAGVMVICRALAVVVLTYRFLMLG